MVARQRTGGLRSEADAAGAAPYTNGRYDMAGKFELYKDKSDKYRWRLKAGNGEVIAVGEAYDSKAGAENGIESVKRNAVEASVDDQTD
jgi:uncharacterized protein